MKEGIYWIGDRCYNVVRLFDICMPRREKIAQNATRLYRNGRYLGNCTIMFEVAPELCALLKSK